MIGDYRWDFIDLATFALGAIVIRLALTLGALVALGVIRLALTALGIIRLALTLGVVIALLALGIIRLALTLGGAFGQAISEALQVGPMSRMVRIGIGDSSGIVKPNRTLNSDRRGMALRRSSKAWSYGNFSCVL